MRIPESELILNPDGSVYHLNLKPGQIAKDIITVGDPDRVDAVSKHLDSIDLEVSKREFKTITGTCKGKRLTIISTGIGTDNIDIVFTELDALVNIDFETRERKAQHTTLNFYRIGTTGSLISRLQVDQVVISRAAIGLDGLMHYYEVNYSRMEEELKKISGESLADLEGISPYAIEGSTALCAKFSSVGMQGVTVTATGFYGPQGRHVIAAPKKRDFIDNLAALEYHGIPFTNLEMETAGIYGMARVLGHEAISISAVLANRQDQVFSTQPSETVSKLIAECIQIITV